MAAGCRLQISCPIHMFESQCVSTPSCTRHSVLYDDGEREAVLLASEKLKWLLPPEVGPSEDTERRRPRRRTFVESSDDVSSFFVPVQNCFMLPYHPVLRT